MTERIGWERIVDMSANNRDKLRGKAISALMKDAHAHYRRAHFKTCAEIVYRSGLLEDAEKDWPRFLAMTRTELVRYIRERELRTEEYKQARRDEHRKRRAKTSGRQSEGLSACGNGADGDGD